MRIENLRTKGGCEQMVPLRPRRATPTCDCIALVSRSTASSCVRAHKFCSSVASLQNTRTWFVCLLAAFSMMALPLIARADPELSEIVVTAERRSERSQDVPIAISSVSANDLRDLGARQAADITAEVPNMMLNLPFGPEAQPTFTLRGVTTQDYSQNQSSPIAMYVDEVYKSVGAVQALQIFDLDRVEVLRGPQGTLYGKNATGGAISFYSKNPSLTDYDGYATLGVGNFAAQTVRAALGGPLIDGVLGWRAAVLYEERKGWMDSIVPGVRPLNGVNALAGRFSLLF